MKDKKIRLSVDERSAILQAVENTPFLGIHSEAVSKIKKKMRVKLPTENGEPKMQPVADLVKRLPPRQGAK